MNQRQDTSVLLQKPLLKQCWQSQASLTAKEIRSVKAYETTSHRSDWNSMYTHLCWPLIILNYFQPSLQHTHFQLFCILLKLQDKVSSHLLLKNVCLPCSLLGSEASLGTLVLFLTGYNIWILDMFKFYFQIMLLLLYMQHYDLPRMPRSQWYMSFYKHYIIIIIAIALMQGERLLQERHLMAISL